MEHLEMDFPPFLHCSISPFLFGESYHNIIKITWPIIGASTLKDLDCLWTLIHILRPGSGGRQGLLYTQPISTPRGRDTHTITDLHTDYTRFSPINNKGVLNTIQNGVWFLYHHRFNQTKIPSSTSSTTFYNYRQLHHLLHHQHLQLQQHLWHWTD